MVTELGAHSPRIERVRDLLTARGRRAQGRYGIEGPTLIAEAQRSAVRICELYAVAASLAEHPALANDATLPVFIVSGKVFARLSDLDAPTGLLAVVDVAAADPLDILARPGTVLLLAGVNDPGNAGTLVRSAEAFGAAGVLFGSGGVDPFSPKVVRAAMGSLFRVPVATIGAPALLAALAQTQRVLLAADAAGDDIGLIERLSDAVLAIGNERCGVRDWLPRWDRAVKIPQTGAAESLNAAVAGSILLYVLSRNG